MKHYRKEAKKEEKKIAFPEFNCPNCKKNTQLTFDPISDVQKWFAFVCSKCGVAPFEKKRMIDYRAKEE